MDTIINKLSRTELIDQIRSYEIQLRDLQLKEEPEDGDKKTLQTELKEDLKNTILKFKQAFDNLPVQNITALGSTDTVQEYVMATKKNKCYLIQSKMWVN